MLARVLIVVAAVGAVVLLAGRIHDDRRCGPAERRMFRAAELSATELRATLRTLRDTCAGSDALASAAGALHAAGRDGLGAALARQATREESDNYAGWVALGVALERADPAAAAAARRRAAKLNPLYRPARTQGRAVPLRPGAAGDAGARP